MASNSSVREILLKMHGGTFDLDHFFEAIEKETGGKLTFTNFKNYLDKHYDNILKSKNKKFNEIKIFKIFKKNSRPHNPP